MGRETWAAGTIPVVVGLAVSMARDLLAGRLGVDAVAFVSMSAALLLGEPLAGAVVAVMYAGGNLLEDFAVARAERDLKSLVDRAPRVAHRRIDTLDRGCGDRSSCYWRHHSGSRGRSHSGRRPHLGRQRYG